MSTGRFHAGGNPAMDLHHTQREVEITPSHFMLQNNTQWPDGLLGLYADLSFQGTVFLLVPPLLSYVHLTPTVVLVPIISLGNVLETAPSCVACVAAISFPFSGGAEIEQANKKRASEGARLG